MAGHRTGAERRWLARDLTHARREASRRRPFMRADTRHWLTGDTPGRLLSDRGAIRDD